MARRLGHAENPRVARHMEKLPLVSHDQGRLGSRRQGWQVRRCRRRSADLLVQQLRSAKMAHLRGGSRSRYALGQDRIAFRIPDSDSRMEGARISQDERLAGRGQPKNLYEVRGDRLKLDVHPHQAGVVHGRGDYIRQRRHKTARKSDVRVVKHPGDFARAQARQMTP